MMTCPVCGAYLDMRDLGQILAHVHDAKIELCEGAEPPSVRPLLQRRAGFGKPTARVGILRIARNNHRVSTTARLAVEYPVFESSRPRLNF
jgi:hypothetical protein